MLFKLNCPLLLFVICYCVLCIMCLTPRTFVDNLDHIESFTPYDVDYDSCDYVDVGESISISSGDLAIMQLNIRGLYSKIDKLKALLNECTLGKN